VTEKFLNIGISGERTGATLVAARGCWPGVEVAEAEFVAYVAERPPEGLTDEQAVAPERMADLYVACACARGDDKAIAALESRYLASLPQLLRRTCSSEDLVADAIQTLRAKIFGERRIREYAGRGSLEGWLRIAAARTLLTLVDKHQRHQPVGEPGIDDVILSKVDPELEYIKARYRADFHHAFHDALDLLSADERTILRLHVIDGLNIAEIGALRKVHRATVARWIAGARARILAETRRRLAIRLKVEPGELDSILGLMCSQLGDSLHRVLVAAAAA
jgi:RNA polymerase sigma-70 factor, ECF subfamily